MAGGKYAKCRYDLPTLPLRAGPGEFSGGLCMASVSPISILVLSWFSQPSTRRKKLAFGVLGVTRTARTHSAASPESANPWLDGNQARHLTRGVVARPSTKSRGIL
jgi:hypothetical protein